MAEIVLCTGSKVAVRGAGSTLTVGATSLTTRSYVVDDFDLVIELIPRFQRWNGNLGLYRPAGKGDTHTIIEEGQQFFSNEEDLYQWIAWARRWGGELHYTSDGLLLRWQARHRGAEEAGPERSLNVDVVQLMLRGRKPHGLSGADDAAFTITNAKSGCVVGAAMHSTYVASDPARTAGRAYSGWARDVMKAHGMILRHRSKIALRMGVPHGPVDHGARRRLEVTTGGSRLSCRWIARARSSSSSTDCAPGTPAAHDFVAPSCRTKNSPESGPFVSREKSNDFSSGESKGPISVPLALISAPSLRLSDQPSGVKLAIRRSRRPSR